MACNPEVLKQAPLFALLDDEELAVLAGQVELQTGGSVEIMENGATSWSVDPGGDLPGSPEPLVVVRVTVPDPKTIDATRLDAVVASAKPAHVLHRIELVKGGGAATG